MDGMQTDSAAGSPAGRQGRPPLRRYWRPAALGCWTAIWFAFLARNGGVAWKFFIQGSLLLFTGHDGGSTKAAGLHLYASYPKLQIGPLAFAVAQVLRHLGPDGGIVTAELAMTAAGLFMLYAIERIALTVRPELALRPARLQRVMLAGGAVFMVAWAELAVEFGHLDDVIALLCAVLAVWAGILRRPVLTGLCVGLAADAKPWALIFLPLLLLAGGAGQAGWAGRPWAGRRKPAGTAAPGALGSLDATGPQDALVRQDAAAPQDAAGPLAAAGPQDAAGPRAAAGPPAAGALAGPALAVAVAAATALVTIAAGWLPFYIADPGTIAAAHFTITNLPDSALRALGVHAARTPSWDRPAQAVAGCVLGTLVLLRRRWLGVILLAVGARIALDPAAHAYYTAGVMAGALLWDCVGARRPFPLWSLLTLGALTVVPLLSADTALQGRFRLGLVVAFTLAILLMPARWCWQPAAGFARQDGATTTPIMPGPV